MRTTANFLLTGGNKNLMQEVVVEVMFVLDFDKKNMKCLFLINLNF